MTEMLIGGTFVMLGVVLLITGWSQVYQAHREGRFVKDGLWRDPSSSVPRHHACRIRPNRALADTPHFNTLSRDCACLCSTRAQGRTRNGRAFRYGLSGLHAASTKVFPATGQLGPVVRQLAAVIGGSE